MTKSISPRAVLETIPGWENANWRPLKGGLSNQTFLVETARQKGVLKIDTAPRTAGLNRRIDEKRIQTTAAEKLLAAPVLFAAERVYLSEYLPGRAWTSTDLRDEANLERLAELLKRVHALPSTGRRFDAIEAARHYFVTARNVDAAVAKECEHVIAAMPLPSLLRCCHNDLVAENIVATPSLRLLDWEYACDNDPLFDLATIVAHHELNESHKGILLNSYFNGDAERWTTRLEQYIETYRALLWLWTAAQAAER